MISFHSFPADSIAKTTAKILLEVQAVHFSIKTPFKLTSGKISPVYIDCRKLISFPRARCALMQMAHSLILNNIGFEKIDAVAGGETAGIPFAAWLADRLMLPMQYVRKRPKGFGRNAQIEGHVEPGTQILLVEDLATDGLSKQHFCTVLRQAGATVQDIFVLFYYNIFKAAPRIFEQLGIQLHTLATWWDILHVAQDQHSFTPEVLTEVEKFLHAPEQWSMDHGGTIESSPSTNL